MLLLIVVVTAGGRPPWTLMGSLGVISMRRRVWMPLQVIVAPISGGAVEILDLSVR